MKKLYMYDGTDLMIDDYVTPEMFGAKGDGSTNDTTAIQNAVNNGGFVLFTPGKHYVTNNVVRLVGNTIIDLNGSTLECTNKHMFFNFLGSSTDTLYNGNGNIIIRNGILVGGATSFGHARNVLLENLILQNSHNDHFLEICACNNYVIRNCRFVGMEYLTTSVMEYINIDPCSRSPFPWLDNASSPFYDGTVNDGITIEGCYFSIGSDTYAYGFNAIGVHASDGQKHQNIRIVNNEITGFTGCGMRINNMNGVLIDGNLVNVPASGANGIRVGDVSQSTNVIIKGNVISASGTAVTKENNSTVFQSADNDINPTFS